MEDIMYPLINHTHCMVHTLMIHTHYAEDIVSYPLISHTHSWPPQDKYLILLCMRSYVSDTLY